MAAFKEALHELNPSIPLILQPGNHDIGQRPTPADVQRYRERFGDDYFSFWVTHHAQRHKPARLATRSASNPLGY